MAAQLEQMKAAEQVRNSAAKEEQTKAAEQVRSAAAKEVQRKSLEASQQMADSQRELESSNDTRNQSNRTKAAAVSPVRPVAASVPPPESHPSNTSRPLPPAPKRAFGSDKVDSVSQAAAKKNVTRAAGMNQSNPQRKVPLRTLRKFFAKSTGVHGLFTKPSHTRPQRSKVGSRPPAKPMTATPVSAITATKPTTGTTGTPEKPNVIKHTLGGIAFQKPAT